MCTEMGRSGLTNLNNNAPILNTGLGVILLNVLLNLGLETISCFRAALGALLK